MRRAKKNLALVLAPLLVSLLAAGGDGGCSRDFPPYNRLTDLRVLGIQSEPPAPGPGEVATLSALVFTPPGFPAPSYKWSWCPFPGLSNDGYKCQITEAEIAQMFPGQAGQVPSFDLGTGETATLPNSIDPGLLQALCAGVGGGPPLADCAHGFPFQVELTVTTDSDDPAFDEEVKAVTTARWRFDAAMPPNTNPPIGILTATVAGGSPEELTETPATTPLPRDVATQIEAQIPRAAAEPYDGFDDDGNPRPLTERLFMTWFVETGWTDDTRTSFSPTTNGDAADPAEDTRRFQKLQRNTWTPELEKDYRPNTARLYVVIHDNRGGVSWKSGIVQVKSGSAP